MSTLIVVPALNEAAHMDRLLHELLPFAKAEAALIVVADGGSEDGTRRIVADFAAKHDEVRLLDNPARLQSAGINAAVRAFGGGRTWLIRIDAHSSYPPDYCKTLLREAERNGADCVVVAMEAAGRTPLQSTIAAAQNSRLGNGGAVHRTGQTGRWVDHGHHALMRLEAFERVGGYDPAFSHNEDAELDHRFKRAGYRIWLTAATRLVYFPRATVPKLMRQYFLFGKGRARNLMKHRLRPALRQALVAFLLPSQLLAVFAFWSPLFLLPALLWVTGCLAGGLFIGLTQASEAGKSLAFGDIIGGFLAGFVAGAMHMAWSAGFWTQVLTSLPKPMEAQDA